MSKAFTREDDDREEDEYIPRSALPEGATNYMTRDGAERLRSELASLEMQRERLIASDDGNPGGERERRRLEARARDIRDSLASAEVVSAPAANDGVVSFGAFVTVRDADGADSEYRIVGVDEVDYDKGWISWLSPLARALIQHCPGERITLRTPEGPRELAVIAVRYG